MNLLFHRSGGPAAPLGLPDEPWSARVHRLVLARRFQGPAGIALLLSLAVLYALAVVNYGPLAALFVPAAAVGGPLLFTTALSQRFGITAAVITAFFLGPVFMASPDVPVGLVQDFLIVLMITGLAVRRIRETGTFRVSTPVNAAIFVWVGMNLVQVANPLASSRLAWFYVMRPAVVYILLFFVVSDALRTRRDLFRTLHLVLALGCISAAWGIYQFFAGYLPFEMQYIIRADAVHLVFNHGRWRSFGTMVSPSQFGMAMAYLSVIAAGYMACGGGFTRRLVLGAAILLLAGGMVYSGTRTSFAMIPVSVAAAVVLSGNRKMLAGGVLLGILMAGVVSMPTSNYQILRIQSAFKGSEDESFNVRKENRKRIMPFIYSHPFGAGMGTTGVWGARFSPGTALASFAPDSGFFRVAVEMGWVGLGAYLSLWLTILWKGFTGLRRMRDPALRPLAIALVSALCAMMLAEYAQELTNKMPSSLVFWVITAILFKTIEFGRTIPGAPDGTYGASYVVAFRA